MHLFRRRRPRRDPAGTDKVYALLDFGASGARAAVARRTPHGVEILGMSQVTGRSDMARPGQVMRRERIANLAERALTAAELSSTGEGALPAIADDAIVGLTGPLLIAEGNSFHLRRDEPAAPIFEDEIVQALAAVQEQSLVAVAAEARASKIRQALVGSQLVGVMSVRADRLQAQRLPDVTRGVPGEAGEYLSIVVCNFTWPAKGLEVLTRVLDDLELRLLSATPVARAVAACAPTADAILVDVGYEHTEIGLAERGALSALRSVPMGGYYFTQMLMLGLNLAEKHAELIKRRSGQEHSRPVARVLADASARWLREVEQGLLELAGEAPLPPHIYLYGGGAALQEVVERLRSHPWTRRLPFERHPVVERMAPHQMRGLYDPRGFLSSGSHVGLAALAAWAAIEPSPLQHHLDTLTYRMAPALDLQCLPTERPQ